MVVYCTASKPAARAAGDVAGDVVDEEDLARRDARHFRRRLKDLRFGLDGADFVAEHDRLEDIGNGGVAAVGQIVPVDVAGVGQQAQPMSGRRETGQDGFD